MAVFPSFIFDTSKGETPQSIAQKRALAAQIMGGFGNRSARNVGEGIGNAFASLGQGITANVMNRRATAGEEAGQASAGDLRRNLINSITGQGSFPAAPTGDISPASLPQTVEAATIRDGLVQRGLPPHVADAFVLNMQDESGLNPGINERNPVVPGSRGGFGLYQLTGPRRRAYEAFAGQRGADPSDVDAQLDFLVSELQGPEARAAQSILSAPDTGTAAQAIVNDFLRPSPEHRQSRASRYAAYQGAPAEGGSGDALSALGSAQPVPVAETEADILAQEQSMAGQDPMAFAPQQAMPQQPTQVAQAGGFPEMAGNNPSQRPPMDLGMLMQVMANPFMDEGTKAFAQAQLQQHMQGQDPMRQLQLERAQLENAALRNPQPDLTTGQREYQMAVQQGYQGSFMDYKRALAEAQRQQTNITVGGDGAPGLGKLSADYGYVLDPETRQPVIDPATGLPQAAPVPGSPAAREIAETERMSQERAGQGQRYGRIVGEDIGRVLDAVEKNPNLVAGPIGSMLSQLPGTGAHDVSSMLGTIRANVGFDRLQAMRASSPTGGALGAVSDSENKMLQATLGALEQSQSPEQFARNLRRLQNIYTEIVHGPAPDGISDDDWTQQAWGLPASRGSKRSIGGYVIEQVD